MYPRIKEHYLLISSQTHDYLCDSDYVGTTQYINFHGRPVTYRIPVSVIPDNSGQHFARQKNFQTSTN